MPFSSDNNLSPLNKEKVNKILEVIIAYARLDFSKKTEVKGNDEVLDAIGAGVNMLGEELETSTISLKEKEQLLKEIHHRVKNNLQIVSSLLNLQSGNIKDQNFLNLIQVSRNRINSMALVHEMLYASRDLTKIEIGEYIQRLSSNIYSSISKPDAEIAFDFKFKSKSFFDIDRMIPLGLILNEIITNSLKYAFPNDKGIISVQMNYKDNKNELTVMDNGIGLPIGFDIEKHANLGLQLIKMLTEQIGGTLNINFEKGTSYRITFS